MTFVLVIHMQAEAVTALVDLSVKNVLDLKVKNASGMGNRPRS